jgi:hypothetical protein
MAMTRFHVTLGAVLWIPKCWDYFTYKGVLFTHDDRVIRRADAWAKTRAVEKSSYRAKTA